MKQNMVMRGQRRSRSRGIPENTIWVAFGGLLMILPRRCPLSLRARVTPWRRQGGVSYKLILDRRDWFE